jgi:hypothetical protein
MVLALLKVSQSAGFRVGFPADMVIMEWYWICDVFNENTIYDN